VAEDGRRVPHNRQLFYPLPASPLGRQKLTTPQQFSVDLREFLDSFDKLAVGGDAGSSLALLVWGLEKEFADTPHPQADSQIIIGTMFVTLVAGTGGFATGQELLDTRASQQVGGGTQLLEQSLLAPTQCERGFALEFECLSHCYS
jgi:hypothetical protein